MTKIELGSNTYNVDLNDNASIINALTNEIKFQYGQHNIKIPKLLNIYVNSRSNLKKTLVFYPVRLNTTNTICCFSDDTEKSMKNLVLKFIKRCEETVKIIQETDEINQEFKNELNALLPNAKITFSEPMPNWYDLKTHATVDHENGRVSIFNDGSSWTFDIEIHEKNKQKAIDTIKKLLN